MIRSLALVAALLASAIAPTGAGGQALINGQPPSLYATTTWVAQQDVTLVARAIP